MNYRSTKSIQNGIVEHHNLIIAEAMEKTLEYGKYESDIDLAWAVIAKIYLQNHLEHNPNDLVFSSNIYTPSVLTN